MTPKNHDSPKMARTLSAKISLETLLQHLVARGNDVARETTVRIAVRNPTSIRLDPRTRHFLERQAEALNTSMQAIITTILDGVVQATHDEHCRTKREL